MGIARAAGDVAAAGINVAGNLAANAATNATNAKIANNTNSANIRMNTENNQTQKLLAQQANELNYKMFNEQNDWNYNMWKEQNEYNDPSAQMTRLLQAGINPIWALGSGAAGEAQQLTSAAAQPAQMAATTPGHIDPYQIQAPNLDVSSANLINSIQDYRRYLLEQKRTKSEIAKTDAETNKIKAENETQDFINRINSVTYYEQVSNVVNNYLESSQRISNLKSQKDLTDRQRELLDSTEDLNKAQKNQIEAATKKLESETFDQLDNLKFRWYTAITGRISANASETSAQAAFMQARTADASLNHMIEKDQREFEMQSNEQILKVIDMQRGWIDRAVGTTTNFLSASIGQSDFEQANRVFSYLKAGYKVISDRVYSNPTKANLDALNDMQNKIKEFQKVGVNTHLFEQTPTNPASVINPIGQSEKW